MSALARTSVRRYRFGVAWTKFLDETSTVNVEAVAPKREWAAAVPHLWTALDLKETLVPRNDDPAMSNTKLHMCYV